MSLASFSIHVKIHVRVCVCIVTLVCMCADDLNILSSMYLLLLFPSTIVNRVTKIKTTSSQSISSARQRTTLEVEQSGIERILLCKCEAVQTFDSDQSHASPGVDGQSCHGR